MRGGRLRGSHLWAEAKKLIEAAEHWARGGFENNAEVVAQLEELGAPPSVIAEVQQQKTDFEVDPDNWETVLLFVQAQTQWRVGMSGPIGFDYCAIEALFRLLEVQNTREQFLALQVMERAALDAISKIAK